MTRTNVIHSGKFQGTIRTGTNCRLASSCMLGDVCDEAGTTGCRVPITSRVAPQGDYLFRAGDQFEAVYMVRSGVIKTCATSTSGREQIIGFHREDDLIGLDAASTDRQICDAVALEGASVCSLSFTQLCELTTVSPTTCERVLRTISRNMKRNGHQLMTLGHLSALQRVASLLCDLSQGNIELGQPGDEFVLPMSRSEIGRYLGMAIETVSRLLTRLRKSGIIAVEGSLITILDGDTLESIAVGEQGEPAQDASSPRQRRVDIPVEPMQQCA